MKRKVFSVVFAAAFALLLPMQSHAAEKALLKSNIPQIYGKSKDAFQGSSDLTIIHIQDAHGNVEAQENVHNIIKSLAEQGKIDAVSDEGGWTEYNRSSYQDARFTDEDREALCDFFVKWGLMHGATRYKVMDNPDVPVIGNEKKALYDQNMEAFRTAHQNKEESQAMAEKIKGAMEALKLKLFDEETRGFLKTLEDFENDRITLTNYARVLQEQADKAGVKWQTYHNFGKVIESIRLEDTIDFARIDRERLDLIDALEAKVEKAVSDEIVTQSLNYRLGRLSAAEYYDFLLSKAADAKIDMNEYKNVEQYAALVKLYAAIDDDALFAEAERLENAVKQSIFQTDVQVNFDRHFKNLEVLTKMIGLEMTRADLAYYNENKPSAKEAVAFLKAQAAAQNLGLEVTDTLGKIDDNLASNEKFYQLAVKRDEVMVEKTLAMMDERGFKTVVLVAGGFHTEGIMKALKAKTVSHMIITPRITNPDAPNYWLQNMLGEKTEGMKVLEEVKNNPEAYTMQSPDESEQTVNVLSAIRAYQRSQAETTLADFQAQLGQAFDAVLAKAFPVANQGTDRETLTPQQQDTIDAVVQAFQDRGFANVNFYDTGSMMFSAEVNGETVTAPVLRQGTDTVNLPSAILELSPENATLLARLLAASERAEVDAAEAGQAINLVTNIQANAPFLHLVLGVLAEQSGMSADQAMNTIRAMYRDQIDVNAEVDLDALRNAGFPTPEQVASVGDELGRTLAGTTVQNLMAAMGLIGVDQRVDSAVEAYGQAYEDILANQDQATIVAMNADEMFDRNIDETVAAFRDTVAPDSEINMNLANLRGGEILAVQAEEDKTVNALVGLIHHRNPQWNNELAPSVDGQPAASERVVVMDINEATKDNVNALRSEGKVVVLRGTDAGTVNAGLKNLTADNQYGARARIAVQEFHGPLARRMLDGFENRLLTYDVARGIPLAMAVSHNALVGNVDQATELIARQGLQEGVERDEVREAVQQFADGLAELDYARMITPITELINALADANSAVAWNA